MMETMPESFKICFFTALLICVLDSPKRFRVVSWIFVSMACVMAVHGILQLKRGYGFAGQQPMWVPSVRAFEEGRFRALFFGTFSDPNDLAQMLVTAMPFTFALFRRRNVITLTISILLLWLLVEGFLTTGSRGGYVALAMTGAMMAVLLFPARWIPTMTLVIGGLALAACPYASAFLDQSAQERIVFWGMANEVFKHNPVFGIGYGMFWQVTSQSRAAHNAFVACYTELGIFGYVFWFGLLALGFIGAYRTRIVLRGMPGEGSVWIRRYSGLIIASTVGYSAGAYFLSRTFLYPIFFLFALMAALPFLVRDYLPEGHKPIINFRKDVLILVPLAAVASILYIYFSILILNKAFYGG
jgi:O-antigen ligase